MKKRIKYILMLLAIGLVGYKSIYFKKLSEVNKMNSEKFDAVAFSKKFGMKDCLPNWIALLNLLHLYKP